MKEEECRLIEAEELANLLGETFRNLTHFVSDDLVFKSVLKGNTGGRVKTPNINN